MIAFSHNIPYLKKKLDRLLKLTDKGWQQDAVGVMEKAAKMLRILTPRSKGPKTQKGARDAQGRFIKGGGSGHLADGWTTRIIGRSGKDRVPVTTIVYNRHATDSAGRRKKSAIVGSGTRGPYTVLDILEFGSRAHVITPGRWKFTKTGRSGAKVGRRTGAKILRFVTSTGEVVYTKRVDHPGTKPYGMIRLTRARLPVLLEVMNLKWKRKIEEDWGRR